MIMYHQTIFGSKMISSSVILDSMSHVKTATQKLLKMYHHTKFGYKRLRGSKDLVWTNN